ncbi:MAG: hypothetical protein ACTS80_00365 [Candidatus Hodgkinia cicadicola]
MLTKRIVRCEVPLLYVNCADSAGTVKPNVSTRNVITNASLVPNYVKLDASSFVEGHIPTFNCVSVAGLRSLLRST